MKKIIMLLVVLFVWSFGYAQFNQCVKEFNPAGIAIEDCEFGCASNEGMKKSFVGVPFAAHMTKCLAIYYGHSLGMYPCPSTGEDVWHITRNIHGMNVQFVYEIY